MNQFKVQYSGQSIIKHYDKIDLETVKSFKPVIFLVLDNKKITVDYYNKFLKLGELKLNEELIIKTKKEKFESIKYKNIYRIERVNKNAEYKKMPTELGLMGKMISKNFYKFNEISVNDRTYYKNMYYTWLNKQNHKKRLESRKITALNLKQGNEQREVA